MYHKYQNIAVIYDFIYPFRVRVLNAWLWIEFKFGASFIASPWSHDLGKEAGFGDRKILSVCGLLRVRKKHEPTF